VTIQNDGGLIRNSLRVVARGFLLGVGFSLASAGAYYLSWQWAMNRTQTAISDSASTSETNPKTLVLSNVEEEQHDGLSAIIGSIKNTGPTRANSVRIEADLFDHGKFVDQYSTYVSGGVDPDGSRYFKISCGCKDSPAAQHDSYKLAVFTGY